MSLHRLSCQSGKAAICFKSIQFFFLMFWPKMLKVLFFSARFNKQFNVSLPLLWGKWIFFILNHGIGHFLWDFVTDKMDATMYFSNWNDSEAITEESRSRANTSRWLKFNHPDNTAVQSVDIWALSFTGSLFSEARNSTWLTQTCYLGGWLHSEVTKTQIITRLVSVLAPTCFRSGHSFGKMWLWISTFILETWDWLCGGPLARDVLWLLTAP